MAQQTALMELLNWVRATLPMDLDTPRMIEEKIESLMDREKEQIMQAVYDSMGTNFDPNWGRAEQYYNETYNK